MGPVSAKISIDVPREQVFDVLVDLSVRPAFMGEVFGRFNLLRENPVGIGAGARFELHEAGWVDSIIDEAERPHRILERGRGGYLNRVPNVTEWLLETQPGDTSCEVKVTFWTEPSKIYDKARDARVSERKLTKGLKHSLAALRDLAEQGTPPQKVVVAGGDRIGLY